MKRTSKPKGRFQASVRNDAAGGVLDLTMYDDIGANWWTGGGITAKWVKGKMETAGAYSSIQLRIDSPGGDSFEGVTIYNLLRSQKKPVHVIVDGLAASAASIIAMAGDTITMGPGTLMMIHNASGGCMGESKDMLKMSEILDKISLSAGEVYVARTGKSQKEVKSLMDAETWMRSQECVDSGFATAVSSDMTREQEPLASARESRLLASYRNVPAELKGAKNENSDGCDCDCENCKADDCENCTNMTCDDPNCEDCPMQAEEEMKAQVIWSNHERTAIPQMFAQMSMAQLDHADYQISNVSAVLALRARGSAVLMLASNGAGPNKAAKITGLLAPYGSPSSDLGGFQEVYQKGCFDKWLAIDDPRVPLNHNVDFILGRKSAGTARFWEAADGLHYEATLPDTQVARDLKVSMERGDIKEASAAFYIMDYRWENRGGVRTRVIEEARLVEGGPHSFAAYGNTTAVTVQPVEDNELEVMGARLRLLKIA